MFGQSPSVPARDSAGLDAAARSGNGDPLPRVVPPNLEAFSQQEWTRIDRSVDRALAWIASQQNDDGSFPSRESGQPGVTSICVMAFLSAGHKPSEGPYGEQLAKAIGYALSCQREEGLFSAEPPIVPLDYWNGATHAATYNHAYTGLMLSEAYGLEDSSRSADLAQAIGKAIALTRTLQERSKKYGVYSGGWRYLEPVTHSHVQSDMTATTSQVMFFRSAMNAGFEIPTDYIDESTAFIKRSFDPQRQEFVYGIQGINPFGTRATMGGGLLCLYLSGESDPKMEQAVNAWMLRDSFLPYNQALNKKDRFHYGTFYMSQAAFQLGGDSWEKIYRKLSTVLLENQNSDGSWPPESHDASFGNVYSSALAVLALTPPYQLLPIYQR